MRTPAETSGAAVEVGASLCWTETMGMMDGKSVIGVLVLACYIAAGSGCGSTSVSRDGPAAPSATTPRDRTLVVIDRGEPPSLASRSLVPAAGVGLGGTQSVFNATLVLLDDQGRTSPYLADSIPQLDTASWMVLPDGRMETVYALRPGLVWHDGTPLTSNDFAFAWRVYGTPVFGQTGSGALASVEDVLSPDARTVLIRWRQPYANAAIEGIPPLPRHLLEQPFQDLDGQAFISHPFWTMEYVGAGPYRLERRDPGVSIEGTAFDAHALGRAKIDRVRIVFMSDANTAVANLLTGSAHFASRFLLYYEEGTTLERQWAAKGGGGTVAWRPTLPRIWIVQLRPEYAVPGELLDLRVRRALAHGIDAAALNQAMTGGRGVVSGTLTSPLADYAAAVNSTVSRYPYDPSAAHRLLEDAGLTKGSSGTYASPRTGTFTLELWNVDGASNERENTIVADDLSRLGIPTSRHSFSVLQSSDNQARATVPGLFATSGGADGEALLPNYTIANIPTADNRWRGSNRGGWANAEYSRVLDAFQTTLDVATRTQQIAEMERIFSQEVPAIPLYFTPEVTAFSSELKGPVESKFPGTVLPLGLVHTWEWK